MHNADDVYSWDPLCDRLEKLKVLLWTVYLHIGKKISESSFARLTTLLRLSHLMKIISLSHWTYPVTWKGVVHMKLYMLSKVYSWWIVAVATVAAMLHALSALIPNTPWMSVEQAKRMLASCWEFIEVSSNHSSNWNTKTIYKRRLTKCYIHLIFGILWKV